MEVGEPRSPEERFAAQCVAELPVVRLREERRAELRARFVAGEIVSSLPPKRATVVPLPVRWGAALALAAAIAGVFFATNRRPEWGIVELRAASGDVRVDGVLFRANERDLWAKLLEPGARIEWTGDAPLVVASRSDLAIQLLPGAEVTLPEGAEDAAGTLRCEIEGGAAQFATGPKFQGERLVIRTAAADVEVFGTTFAVVRGPDFTCVCVLEGAVALRLPRERRIEVPSNRQHVVHDDGRVEEFEGLAEPEIPVLEQFHERTWAMFGPHGAAR